MVVVGYNSTVSNKNIICWSPTTKDYHDRMAIRTAYAQYSIRGSWKSIFPPLNGLNVGFLSETNTYLNSSHIINTV